MTAGYTVQARSARKVLELAEERGADAAAIAHAAGLDRTALDDPEARIPDAVLFRLYELGAEATGDECFGLHIGERVDMRGFDVLGYAVLSSRTLGDALERAARYYAIWTDGTELAIERAGRAARVRYAYRGRRGVEVRHECESTLAMVLAAARAATGVGLVPKRVTFEHAAPSDDTEHRRLFGVRPRFGAEANEVVFDAEMLDLGMVSADAGLCDVLDRHATSLLAERPASAATTADRVRAALRRALGGGDPSLEAMARALGLSARTLQRRLRDEGTSHQELLDAMRREMAERYLERSDVALCEVAYLLGYSEPAAFHRAFRRWTGTTPTAFRRRP